MTEIEKDANEVFARILDYRKTQPDAIALIDDRGNKILTYRDFASLNDGIAAKLMDCNVKPGDVVSIRLGRCAEHMASRLACLCIGAVPLSIDPLIPEERAQMLMKISGTKFVIDKDFFPVANCPESIEYPKLPDNAPGYLVFTSGSTGVPKGILHPRGTFLFFIKIFMKTGIDLRGKRLGSIASVSFNVSTFEFLFVFHEGSTMVMIDDALRSDIPSVRDFVRKQDITAMVATPGYYRAVGNNCGLKVVGLTGERTGPMKYIPDVDVFNFYGTTESVTSFSKLERDTEDMTIGTPLPGCTVKLLDENGKEADVGEICYYGEGIMLGYLHEMKDGIPETPAKFYRSGDLGRKDPDGVRVIGRIGGMVKINGQRVEPAETEYVMTHIPGITSAVVKSFDDNGTYLCGYYQGTPEPNEVRAILMSKLSSYMIPAFISKVEKFPVNRNGKIDRQSLKTLKPTSGKTSAPENDMQRAVCEAFAKTLGVEEVGIDDDFIELGGDSLGVSKLVSLFDTLKEKDSDVTIKPQDIMYLRTPRKIAANLRTPVTMKKYDLITGGPAPDSVKDGYVMMKVFGEKYFSLPILITVDKWKDFDDAEKQIRMLIKAFPVLSMRLEHHDEKLWMMFDREPEIIRSETDMKNCKVEDISGFDPDTDVSSRFFIFKHEGKVSVIAVMSHLVFDGRSSKPLITASLMGRNEVDMGILIQGAYDEAIKNTDRYQRSKELCLSALKPVFSEKVEPLPKYDVFSPGMLLAPMDTKVEDVRKFAKECKVSITTILAMAFGIAKAKVAGTKESTFSLVTGGRSAPGTEDSVGMFTKVIPVHMSMKDMDIRDYIEHYSQTISKLIANDEFSVCDLEPEKFPDMNFLFQYSDYMEDLSKGVPGITTDLMIGGAWVSGSSMMVLPINGVLMIRIRYCSKYREEEVTELLCDFDEVLEKMFTAKNSKELFNDGN